MGIIDEYLANIKSQQQQTAQQNTVLGYPSSRQEVPTVQQAYRDPSVSSSGSAANLDEKYNPKDNINDVSSSKRSADSRQQQASAVNSASQSESSPVAQQAFDMVKSGYNLYRTASKVTPRVSDIVGSAANTSVDPEVAGIGASAAGSGLSGAGSSAAGSGLSSAGASAVGSAGSGVATTGILDTASSAISSALGTVGSVVSIAAPYYAAARAVGMAINMITANNPDMKETPFGVLGEDLSTPLQVESKWADRFQDELGVPEWLGDAWAIGSNPINLLEKLGLGTVVCTELYIQGRISRETYRADAQFGMKMDRHEYDWYLSWARPLVAKMKKSKVISSVVSFFMAPVSQYMAGEMGVGKGSLFGKVNFKILQTVCKIVGGK